MNIFLSGGGSSEKSKEFDKLFLSNLDLSKPLLYIPIAMKRSKSSEECYNWLSTSLNKIKKIKIEVWSDSDLNGKTLEGLKKYCGIYIGGGNTFSLMSDLKKYGFNKILIKYINRGGFYYGGSAGAIILGEKLLSDEDKLIKDIKGLSIISGVIILCHYNKENLELAKKLSSEQRVIALEEGSGIFYIKGSFKNGGIGKVRIFRKGKLLNSKKLFELF